MLLAACLPLALASAQTGDTPDPGGNGTPGVESGTCWKNSSGNLVSVELSGGVHGNYKVKLTEGKKSGTGTGRPDFDGGISKSSEIDVGKETYKAKNGKMKWKNPKGHWITMTKVKCPDEADMQ